MCKYTRIQKPASYRLMLCFHELYLALYEKVVGCI